MSALIDTPVATAELDGSATRAADRMGSSALALGALGFAACGIVIFRLATVWRVTPAAAGHRITVLGLGLSYPAADAGAFVVLGLALAGLAAALLAIAGVIREVIADLRVSHRLQRSARAHGDDVLVLARSVPDAFCAGWLRPRVYVTTGALAVLDAQALEAVLAHERGHVSRRDPLRRAVARVVSDALFFLPAIRTLTRQERVLAEVSADSAAAHSHGPAALARALLVFEEHGGIDPARVDHLVGSGPRWRFPFLACVLTAGAVAATIGLAVLLSSAASGTATLAPPVLSAQPCVLVLAFIASLVLAVGAQGMRWRRR